MIGHGEIDDDDLARRTAPTDSPRNGVKGDKGSRGRLTTTTIMTSAVDLRVIPFKVNRDSSYLA